MRKAGTAANCRLPRPAGTAASVVGGERSFPPASHSGVRIGISFARRRSLALVPFRRSLLSGLGRVDFSSRRGCVQNNGTNALVRRLPSRITKRKQNFAFQLGLMSPLNLLSPLSFTGSFRTMNSGRKQTSIFQLYFSGSLPRPPGTAGLSASDASESRRAGDGSGTGRLPARRRSLAIVPFPRSWSRVTWHRLPACDLLADWPLPHGAEQDWAR